MTITRDHLAATVTTACRKNKECENITKEEVRSIVDSVFKEITKKLISKESVKIPKFGTFTSRITPSRPARNPKTLVPCSIPERTAIFFKASKKLKEKVKDAKR